MQQGKKGTHLVTVSARINAAPERVYAVIADYRNGHPRILPKEFTGLTVERGGAGDGTIIQFGMRMFGRTRSFRAAIERALSTRFLHPIYVKNWLFWRRAWSKPSTHNAFR